jgi:hypothetical protein
MAKQISSNGKKYSKRCRTLIALTFLLNKVLLMTKIKTTRT